MKRYQAIKYKLLIAILDDMNKAMLTRAVMIDIYMQGYFTWKRQTKTWRKI